MTLMIAPSEVVLLILHIIGTLLCLALAAVFHIAALNRFRAIDRLMEVGRSTEAKKDQVSHLSSSSSSSSSTPLLFEHRIQDSQQLTSSNNCDWPSIAVIMPVKGIREYSVSNWKSQLDSDYTGRLHFFFITDSEGDPAFSTAKQLASSFLVTSELGHDSASGAMPHNRQVTIISAGRAATCSQKIHNILAGIEASSCVSRALENPPGSKALGESTRLDDPSLLHQDSRDASFDLILFLDDDVQLHPHAIASLASELSTQQDVFAVTGYPLDIPSPSSLFSYFAAGFHWSIIAWLSVAPTSEFLWGGCMMLRAKDIYSNALNLLDKWRDGGYSDDMILSALAVENRKLLLCPRYAVFPQRLPSHMTAWQWWNYQRRQLFVLSMHVSAAHRAMNLQLLLLGCFLGFFLSSPFLATAWTVSSHAAALIRSLLASSHSPPFWVLSAVVSPSAAPYPPVTLWLAVVPYCHVAAFLVASWGLHRMLRALCCLCHALNPTAVPPADKQMRLFPLPLVWLAINVTWLVFALLAVANAFVPEIEWAGIRYRRRKNGKCEPVWSEG